MNAEKNKINHYCWLCNREFNTSDGRFPVGPSTRHHIIPKQKFREKWKDADIVLLCKRCHKQIHKMFSNNELKNMTKLDIKNHEKVKKYVKWINK